MGPPIFFGLIIFLFRLSAGVNFQDYSCSGSAGDPPDPSKHTAGPDTNIGLNYVAEDPKYTFQCCALITEWSIVPGNEGTIQLQVWRRLSDNSYQMIGENYCIITSADIATVKTCPVDVQDQIGVQKGDFIGWHSNGEETLMYISDHYTADHLSVMFRRVKPIASAGTGDLHPGQLYDWSGEPVYNDRDYGILATYVESTEPVISLMSPITLPDHNISTFTVTRITYSDSDVQDNATLTKYLSQSSPFFSVDLDSGFVTGATNYPYRTRASEIGLFVYDTCYKYNQAADTVTFTVDEQPLKLTSLPASFTLPENQTSQTLLHTITWSDAAGDPVYCRYTGNDPFMLQPLSTSEYGLYVCEHPGFDFDTASTYSLTITCTENRISSTVDAFGTVTIYITENLSPRITNLDASVTVDAETAKIGDVVYTVSTYDPEGDAITFSSVCTPASSGCPLELRQNGEIQINSGLLFSQSHYYDLEITIRDSHNNQDGPNFFSLTISNINNDASFINLPLSVNLEVMENTPVDTPLYTILYRDRDLSDTKTYTVIYSDDRLSTLFNLDPTTGVLSTAFNEIDYEAFTHPTTYTLTVALGDTKSDITETINIEFINQNEPPRFTKDYFDITVEEGDDGVWLNNDPSLNFPDYVLDEDDLEVLNAEEHKYSLDCESGTQTHRFYLDPTTAKLTFKGPFDLDTENTPNEVSCVITVTDKYGLTDTADIHIHVTNVNEFSPEFSQPSYTIYVQPNTLVGTSVLTVSADDLDADIDSDKEFYYTLDQVALGKDYFHIDQKGRIYLIESLLSFSLGQDLGSFTAEVTNVNSVLSGTATIRAIIPGSTTTAAGTTTDRNKGFYEDFWNIIWLLLVLGGVIIILLAISVVMFQIMRPDIIPIWCRNCCRDYKENSPCWRPRPEPERGFGDRGYDLASFGHEHKYTDDDEIDGWVPRKGPKDNKKNMSGYQQFGVPTEAPIQKSYKEPVYEMFRVPTPPQNQDNSAPRVTWKRGVRY